MAFQKPGHMSKFIWFSLLEVPIWNHCLKYDTYYHCL